MGRGRGGVGFTSVDGNDEEEGTDGILNADYDSYHSQNLRSIIL